MKKTRNLPVGIFGCHYFNQWLSTIVLLDILVLSACSIQAVPVLQETQTVTSQLFATATLVPTITSRPSATLAPPTIAATITPVMAVVTSQVNVRAAPNKDAISLGLLNYGARVQVIGKDTNGAWWQIIYPENSTLKGWVSAAYVQVPEGEAGNIPVVQLEAAIQSAHSPEPNETQQPLASNPTSALIEHTAKVLKQMFVRTGPGQTFASLGMVNADTLVLLTGRNQNNVWAQIKFEGGTEGKGWVAVAYLAEADLVGLPIFDNQGNQISEGTLGANSGQPTLTATAYSPAPADADSEQSPAVRLVFSPDGVREFIYSSELSSPNGDSTDWVAFTPFEPTNQSTFLYFTLECSGNGGITATLEKDGNPVPGMKPLLCGNYDMAMKVLGGQEYILVLVADGSGGPIRYTRYNLYIRSDR